MERPRRSVLRSAGALTMFFLVWMFAVAFFSASVYSLLVYLTDIPDIHGQDDHDVTLSGYEHNSKYVHSAAVIRTNLDADEYKDGERETYHELKVLLRNSKLNKLNISDDFLARFSNARLDDAKKTFILMRNYFSIRKSRPDLFLNATAILAKFQPPIFHYQDERTHDGRPIVYMKLANWNTGKHTFLQAMASMVPFAEYMTLKEPEIGRKEGITIIDMSGWTLSQTWKVSEIELMTQLTERSMVVRPGPTHICHNSWAVSALFTLMRPFMSDDVQSKLVFHGHDLTSLHAAIPKEILPKPVGGHVDLKSYTAQELDHMDSVLENYWNSYPAIS
ncbi:Clavesin-2 [Halotydeus destructor]|nr:Clavesin-2 [Halotydeus destructor]